MIQVASRDLRSIASRYMPKLPDELDIQLDYHCNILGELNRRSHEPRPNFTRELEFLRWAFASFIASRNSRIQELRSDDIRHVNEIKDSLLPYRGFYFWLCVDSRVGAKAYGFHRRALRFPAGETNEFYSDSLTGSLSIHQNSRIAQIILKELEDPNTQVLAEVIESHLECAKRAEIEGQLHVRSFEDFGLYYDIVRKRAKVQALNKLLFELFAGKKRLFVTHTSLDPENGYCYLGLEQCLRDPLAIQYGFTRQVLENFVREGKIISTQELVNGDHAPAIKAKFHQYRFAIDFANDYVTSTVQLWEALRDMADDLVPIFERAISHVYPSTNTGAYPNELRQRAVLLLANSFTAYLLNLCEGGYPYREHKEEIIAVTYNGDRGPFGIMIPFSNDPSSPELGDDIFFTDYLVRQNRAHDRMTPDTREVANALGFSREEFVKACVPLVLFERVKQVHPDMQDIQRANWSDLLGVPWGSKSFDFEGYLMNKFGGITRVTSNAIMDLHKRMSTLYAPGTRAVKRLWAQDTVPLPVIADADRRVLGIVSFNRIGCDHSNFVP